MDGSRITGINTEDSSRDEGTVHYDIIFYLSIPAGIDKVPVKEFVRRIANMNKMYNVGDFL